MASMKSHPLVDASLADAVKQLPNHNSDSIDNVSIELPVDKLSSFLKDYLRIDNRSNHEKTIICFSKATLIRESLADTADSCGRAIGEIIAAYSSCFSHVENFFLNLQRIVFALPGLLCSSCTEISFSNAQCNTKYRNQLIQLIRATKIVQIQVVKINSQFDASRVMEMLDFCSRVIHWSSAIVILLEAQRLQVQSDLQISNLCCISDQAGSDILSSSDAAALLILLEAEIHFYCYNLKPCLERMSQLLSNHTIGTREQRAEIISRYCQNLSTSAGKLLVLDSGRKYMTTSCSKLLDYSRYHSMLLSSLSYIVVLVEQIASKCLTIKLLEDNKARELLFKLWKCVQLLPSSDDEGINCGYLAELPVVFRWDASFALLTSLSTHMGNAHPICTFIDGNLKAINAMHQVSNLLQYIVGYMQPSPSLSLVSASTTAATATVTGTAALATELFLEQNWHYKQHYLPSEHVWYSFVEDLLPCMDCQQLASISGCDQYLSNWKVSSSSFWFLMLFLHYLLSDFDEIHIALASRFDSRIEEEIDLLVFATIVVCTDQGDRFVSATHRLVALVHSISRYIASSEMKSSQYRSLVQCLEGWLNKKLIAPVQRDKVRAIDVSTSDATNATAITTVASAASAAVLSNNHAHSANSGADYQTMLISSAISDNVVESDYFPIYKITSAALSSVSRNGGSNLAEHFRELHQHFLSIPTDHLASTKWICNASFEGKAHLLAQLSFNKLLARRIASGELSYSFISNRRESYHLLNSDVTSSVLQTLPMRRRNQRVQLFAHLKQQQEQHQQQQEQMNMLVSRYLLIESDFEKKWFGQHAFNADFHVYNNYSNNQLFLSKTRVCDLSTMFSAKVDEINRKNQLPDNFVDTNSVSYLTVHLLSTCSLTLVKGLCNWSIDQRSASPITADEGEAYKQFAEIKKIKEIVKKYLILIDIDLIVSLLKWHMSRLVSTDSTFYSSVNRNSSSSSNDRDCLTAINFKDLQQRNFDYIVSCVAIIDILLEQTNCDVKASDNANNRIKLQVLLQVMDSDMIARLSSELCTTTDGVWIHDCIALLYALCRRHTSHCSSSKRGFNCDELRLFMFPITYVAWSMGISSSQRSARKSATVLPFSDTDLKYFIEKDLEILFASFDLIPSTSPIQKIDLQVDPNIFYICKAIDTQSRRQPQVASYRVSRRSNPQRISRLSAIEFEYTYKGIATEVSWSLQSSTAEVDHEKKADTNLAEFVLCCDAIQLLTSFETTQEIQLSLLQKESIQNGMFGRIYASIVDSLDAKQYLMKARFNCGFFRIAISSDHRFSGLQLLLRMLAVDELSSFRIYLFRVTFDWLQQRLLRSATASFSRLLANEGSSRPGRSAFVLIELAATELHRAMQQILQHIPALSTALSTTIDVNPLARINILCSIPVSIWSTVAFGASEGSSDGHISDANSAVWNALFAILSLLLNMERIKQWDEKLIVSCERKLKCIILGCCAIVMHAIESKRNHDIEVKDFMELSFVTIRDAIAFLLRHQMADIPVDDVIAEISMDLSEQNCELGFEWVRSVLQVEHEDGTQSSSCLSSFSWSPAVDFKLLNISTNQHWLHEKGIAWGLASLAAPTLSQTFAVVGPSNQSDQSLKPAATTILNATLSPPSLLATPQHEKHHGTFEISQSLTTVESTPSDSNIIDNDTLPFALLPTKMSSSGTATIKKRGRSNSSKSHKSVDELRAAFNSGMPTDKKGSVNESLSAGRASTHRASKHVSLQQFELIRSVDTMSTEKKLNDDGEKKRKRPKDFSKTKNDTYEVWEDASELERRFGNW